MSPQAVSQWIAGSDPRPEHRQRIAEFFGMHEAELLLGGLVSQKGARVPVIPFDLAPRARAIINGHTPSFHERYFFASVQVREHTFAVEVHGDSMVNPNGWPSFPPGTLIVVEPDLPARDGDFVIAADREGRPTFKQLVIDGGRRYLKPLNPRFPIIEIGPDTQIVGVVREFGAVIR